MGRAMSPTAVMAHRICNQETGTDVLPHLVEHIRYRHYRLEAA